MMAARIESSLRTGARGDGGTDAGIAAVVLLAPAAVTSAAATTPIALFDLARGWAGGSADPALDGGPAGATGLRAIDPGDGRTGEEIAGGVAAFGIGRAVTIAADAGGAWVATGGEGGTWTWFAAS